MSVVAKRHRMSCADNHIAQQIDERVPYRTAWPRLPVLHLWSCLEGDPESYFPNYEQIALHVQTLLKKHGISVQSIIPCHRLPYSADASSASENTVTLLIATAPNPRHTRPAITDIRKYLASMDIQVAIELVDGRTVQKRTIAIAASDRESIDRWNGWLRDDLVRKLDSCGQEWISLGLYHRGLEEERSRCPRTVVIGVPQRSKAVWWEQILPDIRNVCPRDLVIELTTQDRGTFAPSREEDAATGRMLAPASFSNRITMGASCGPAGLYDSATMGGMVRLRRQKTDLGTFALTSNRRIISNRLQPGAPATAHKPLHSADRQKHRTTSPSPLLTK